MIDDEDALAAGIQAARKVHQKAVDDAAEAAIAAYLDNVKPIPESPEPEPGPNPGFPVFAVMSHSNQPPLHQFGITELKMWYESSVTSNGNPDKAKLQAAARQSHGFAVLDIESWADHDNSEGRGYWRVDDDGLEKYIQALSWYREAMPTGHGVALYSILPVRNYHDAIDAPDAASFKRWQRWNDEVKPLVPYVDVLLPSCYTFYEDRDEWALYAWRQVQEAKRIGEGKPVYPVLWPRYHGNKHRLPGDYWKQQLAVCRNRADGVLIWDDWSKGRGNFNDLGDWWTVTKEFAANV